MKHIETIILTIGLFGLLSCQGQQDDRKTFNSTYEVGGVPNISDFQIYNEQEKEFDSFEIQSDNEMDSLFHADTTQRMSEIFRKKDFRNNRSRIFMEFYTNGKLNEKEILSKKSYSTRCECNIYKDTLLITMGIDFFGGIGFNLEIIKDNFDVNFSEYTDDVKPYKSNLNDTAFYNYFHVKSKYQFLVLNDKPSFQTGQQLTGYMTFSSNNFYVQKYDNQLDTNYVTSKLYFTCKTRQETKWDGK